MKNANLVSREKFKKAFSQIRKDIAALQRDIAVAEGNRTNWIFIIMFLVAAIFVNDLFGIETRASIGIAMGAICVYKIIDGIRIRRNAMKMLKEPLEPMWDTDIDLS